MSAMTGGVGNGVDGELVPVGPPPTLRANLWATAVWCALSILSNVILFGDRPYLRKSLIQQNAKAKKPIADYTAARVEHDVHSQLVGGLIEALLVSVILLLLAGLAWRGRRWARWVLLLLAVIGLPLRVGVLSQLVAGAVPSSAPGLYRFSLVVGGFAALVVVVLLLHRTTRAYFAALRETERGALPPVPGSRLSAQRPGGGLGALFAPRRRPATGATLAADADDSAADTGSTFGDTADQDTADQDTAAGSDGRPAAARRSTATRPGRVKAKGTAGRAGRFKSRQQ
jgi:hypothetical protein